MTCSSPCAPFATTLWLEAAVVDPQQAPQTTPQTGGGCRWRGPEMTASFAVARGRSLRDISTDPAYRPGDRGWDGNSFWPLEHRPSPTTISTTAEYLRSPAGSRV